MIPKTAQRDGEKESYLLGFLIFGSGKFGSKRKWTYTLVHLNRDSSLFVLECSSFFLILITLLFGRGDIFAVVCCSARFWLALAALIEKCFSIEAGIRYTYIHTYIHTYILVVRTGWCCCACNVTHTAAACMVIPISSAGPKFMLSLPARLHMSSRRQ